MGINFHRYGIRNTRGVFFNMNKCGCGRSPTGKCVGWHALTEEKYLEFYKKYEELSEEEKKQAFHPRAIDGYGQ